MPVAQLIPIELLPCSAYMRLLDKNSAYQCQIQSGVKHDRLWHKILRQKVRLQERILDPHTSLRSCRDSIELVSLQETVEIVEDPEIIALNEQIRQPFPIPPAAELRAWMKSRPTLLAQKKKRQNELQLQKAVVEQDRGAAEQAVEGLEEASVRLEDLEYMYVDVEEVRRTIRTALAAIPEEEGDSTPLEKGEVSMRVWLGRQRVTHVSPPDDESKEEEQEEEKQSHDVPSNEGNIVIWLDDEFLCYTLEYFETALRSSIAWQFECGGPLENRTDRIRVR